ncbi:hypothetical protein P7H17_16535 [Paenibacillus larvae]|nr:hypothetical protein [Paenibacillus larvae]MDT2287315.1 hypothetical protein [Paenibacillus larvae]
MTFKKSLSTEQYAAIGYLALPKKGGKTYAGWRYAGFTRTQSGNWRKDQMFEAELKRQMVRNSQEKLPELIDSLTEIAIRDGNRQWQSLRCKSTAC